mmetsp:Transcript_35940/g.79012  ORF Transcript_35940/g.79012 Transcript_35940/m.79012 type:complete len:212 (+) Transcript_35940:2257-2892(+)
MEWSTRRRTMPMTPAAHRQVPDVKLLKYPMWELILKVKPIASVSQLHSCVSQMKDTSEMSGSSKSDSSSTKSRGSSVSSSTWMTNSTVSGSNCMPVHSAKVLCPSGTNVYLTSGCTSRTTCSVLSKGRGLAALSTTMMFSGEICRRMPRTVWPISLAERWAGMIAPHRARNFGSFFQFVGLGGRGVNARRKGSLSAQRTMISAIQKSPPTL